MYRVQNKNTIMRLSIFICFFLVIYSAPLFAKQKYWPTKSWRTSTPEAQGMDSQKLIEMMEYLHENKFNFMPFGKESMVAAGIDPEPFAINSDSITIIRNGYIVFDAFFSPFDRDERHHLYSCTKSVTSILVGIAIDIGYIKNVHQPVLDFFPNKPIANLDGQKRAITLENVLTMSSGLLTRDNMTYNREGLKNMLRSKDCVQYILDLPMAQSPGTKFEYSNCCSHLLSAIVHKTTKMSTFGFAKKNLFVPLGITDVKWGSDPNGITLGAITLELRPYDMAKLGLLFLNNGKWENKQVVSKNWVQQSTKKYQVSPGHPIMGYGYQWWVRPGWYYAAEGARGQRIFVVPDKNMVIVFTSSLISENIPNILLDEYIIPAVASDQALKDQPDKKDHLDSLIANYSQSAMDGFIWEAKEKGFAKNGKFIRTASPSFTFNYPKASRKTTPQFGGPEGMWMRSSVDEGIAVFIHEVPNGLTLQDIKADYYDEFFEKNELGTIQKILMNKKIASKDGTPAVMTEIDYFTEDNWNLRALLVSAIKEGNIVTLYYGFLSMDEVNNAANLKEGESIIQSLVFN